MLSLWFSLFLVALVNPLLETSGPGALTLAPTCRVKGHVMAELTVNCGDGVDAGVVQFWHTPFGDLRAPGPHSDLDPVFMRQDGSLVVPNSSRLHSGLYYCLLQHNQGTTLWPYRLHVGQNQEEEEDGGEEPGCGVIRIRRSSGSEEAESGDGDLAAAVAISVLVTFVFGFSAGALSRTRVLRCLETLSRKLPSLRQRRRRPHGPDDNSDISVSTLPPLHEDLALEMGPVQDHVTMETTTSSSAPCPPVKPQRSFRVKREELQETAAYLEGCDPKMEEEEDEEPRGGREEPRGGEEEQGGSTFYLGVDGGSQGETDMDGENREEDEEEKRSEQERQSEQEAEGNKEEKDETEEEKDEKNPQHEAEENKGEETRPSPPPRRRVIRLYQYDEDGQRYGHLPDPAPEPPVPAPRLKQRLLSLTRLSSIMAAASAGPQEGEGRPHFHMEI